MKIALILYGQPRFINNESVREHYRKIFELYDVDVYGHLWWSKNENIQCSKDVGSRYTGRFKLFFRK